MEKRRREAEPVFGNELELAIDNIHRGIVITGPSGSGKTVLGTTITTLGLAAVGIEIPSRENLLPDFSLAGLTSDDPPRFQQEFEEDVIIALDLYLRSYHGLPPIVMVDEVLPEYASLLRTIPPILRRQYKARYWDEPKVVWILKGDSNVVQGVRSQARFLSKSETIELQPKRHDQNSNNVGYRNAAARAEVLRQQLGPQRFNTLVQKVQTNLSLS